MFLSQDKLPEDLSNMRKLSGVRLACEGIVVLLQLVSAIFSFFAARLLVSNLEICDSDF